MTMKRLLWKLKLIPLKSVRFFIHKMGWIHKNKKKKQKLCEILLSCVTGTLSVKKMYSWTYLCQFQFSMYLLKKLYTTVSLYGLSIGLNLLREIWAFLNVRYKPGSTKNRKYLLETFTSIYYTIRCITKLDSSYRTKQCRIYLIRFMRKCKQPQINSIICAVFIEIWTYCEFMEKKAEIPNSIVLFALYLSRLGFANTINQQEI